MNCDIAPIVLFTYNRLWHIRQTIEALQRNELSKQSELFIYSDGPKDKKDAERVNDVRKYIKSIDGFKEITVIEREKKWGLADNIISGVTEVVEQYGKVIVLEDDLVTSPYFLRFMNDALELYSEEERVACVSGYVFSIKDLPETFFIRGADCWGWGTWERAWKIFEPNGKVLLRELRAKGLKKDFDFNNSYPYTKMLEGQIEGKNQSWAIRWYASSFLRGMLCLYPKRSFIRHIGFTGGTNTGYSRLLDIDKLVDSYSGLVPIRVMEDVSARVKIEKHFRRYKGSLLRRVFVKLYGIIRSDHHNRL